MTSPPHILFTSTFDAPFIREDIRILQSKYPVTVIQHSGIRVFALYISAFRSCDITYSWFASVYSSLLVLLTRMTRKKSVIVLGGVDVAQEKSFRYGIWNSWWKSIIVRFAIRHADKVIAVDNSLRLDAMRLARYDGANIQVIPTGYDADFWKTNIQKDPTVLTIASVPNTQRIMIKGIDIVLDVARTLPTVHFKIVGISDAISRKLSIPPNVECRPLLPHAELRVEYQKAMVYLQLSRREGFPNTVCEAMLCGCIPVGTRVGGIPTAIGSAGYIVDPANVGQAVSAVTSALQSTDAQRKAAREQIMSNFSINRRENELFALLNSLSA